MNIKKTLLAAALAAFAFAAMPALASAASADFEGEEAPFTISEGTEKPVLETAELEVKCQSFTGEGAFESSSTGWIKITFHSCKSFGFFNCTTSGQSTGTITTTKLPFHLGKIGTTPAVLITSNEGHFATFACFGITTKVEGSGVIGTVTSPGFGEPSSEAGVQFSSTGGSQEHQEIEGEGLEGEFDLTANRGGTKETAGQSGNGNLNFEQEVTLTE